MAQDVKNDKRKVGRAPVGEEVEVTFDDFQTFKIEYAQNISVGGMFLRSNQRIPANETIRFRLKIKDLNKEIAGEGIVVWTKETISSADNQVIGMGLKFNKLYGDSEAFIRDFVAKHVDPEGQD